MNKDVYAISCYSLGTVFLIKKISKDKEEQLLNSLVNRTKNLIETIKISSYVEYLVNELFCDPDQFFELIEDQNEVPNDEILAEIYTCIIKHYPFFHLDVVLGISNNKKTEGKKIEIPKSKEMTQDELEEFWKKLGIFNNLNFGKEKKEEEGESAAPTVKAKKSKDKLKIKSLDDLELARKYLYQRVVGQQRAIDIILDQLKNIAAGLYNRTNLFFIGPTGIGKTHTTKLLAKRVFGEKYFYKVNCAEYAKGHEVSKLIGSPPGYVGFGEKPLLRKLAEESNQWVFLFDEVEKAHASLYNFLLSLLDDGTATDNVGSILDFSKSIFIFTSNNGMQDLQIGSSKIGFEKEIVRYEESKETLNKDLRKQFPPEFLGRMDSVIFFNQLTKEDIKKVASLELNDLPVKKTKELLEYISEKGFSEEYGARYMSKFIKKTLAPLIADALLSKKLPKGNKYYSFKVKEDTLEISNFKENENELTS